MKISNNPVKYEVLFKQYLRSILDITDEWLSMAQFGCNLP